MTLLNHIPIKGMAKDFANKNKWTKCKFWYVLTFGKMGCSEAITHKIYALVNWHNRGLGSACILENKKREIIAKGYLLPIENVKPFKYEINRDRRGL